MLLKDGMVFKNYKELCGVMGWNVTGGTYKKARLKELDSRCKWYKDGNKIVIEMVYDYRVAKLDNRTKDNIYVNPVEAILLFALKDMEQPEIYFSNAKMYKLLGMFNDKFEDLNYGDTNAIMEEVVVDYLTAKSFKINSKSEANRIIKRALKSMKNRAVIDFVEGRIVVELNGTHRLATPEEARLFLDIQEKCMWEVGCNSYNQIEYKNLTQKYYKLIKEKVEQLNMKEFAYTYEGYCVISHNRIIAKEIDRQQKDEHFQCMNGLFAKKMKSVAEVRHRSAVKRMEDGTNFGTGMSLGEASETFVGDYDRMIDKYIKI